MSHFGEMAETNISYFSVLVLPNKTSLYLHQIDVLFITWVKTIFLMLSTSTAVVSVKIKLQWHQKKVPYSCGLYVTPCKLKVLNCLRAYIVVQIAILILLYKVL